MGAEQSELSEQCPLRTASWSRELSPCGLLGRQLARLQGAVEVARGKSDHDLGGGRVAGALEHAKPAEQRERHISHRVTKRCRRDRSPREVEDNIRSAPHDEVDDIAITNVQPVDAECAAARSSLREVGQRNRCSSRRRRRRYVPRPGDDRPATSRESRHPRLRAPAPAESHTGTSRAVEQRVRRYLDLETDDRHPLDDRTCAITERPPTIESSTRTPSPTIVPPQAPASREPLRRGARARRHPARNARPRHPPRRSRLDR